MTREDTRTDGNGCTGVWLEIDLDASPIEGTMSFAGGQPKPFVGWLGLTAALEGLRREELGPENPA